MLMFFLWIHVRIPIHCNRTTVILKQFTQDSSRSCTKVIYQSLHLFEAIYDRNGLAQRLDEFNVLILSMYEGYLRLKLWLPHKCTSQLLYDKSWAIACHIWVFHGLTSETNYSWSHHQPIPWIFCCWDECICPIFNFLSGSDLSSWQPHRVFFSDPLRIAYEISGWVIFSR